MPPPRRPTKLGPVPAPAEVSASAVDVDEERTTVDPGSDRWEEQTVAEGGRKPSIGLVIDGEADELIETVDEASPSVLASSPKPSRRPARRGAASRPIHDDEEEATVRAGSDNRVAHGTGESTLDEPTVEDQARPLPPLSVVPPVPKDRNKPRTAPARLLIIEGNDAGREIPLEGKPLTVGRGVDNDVVLTDIAVSRRHLELTFDGTHYCLRDLGSGNGTLINDRLEDGACELRHDDRIEIGNTVFRLDHPASRVEVGGIGFGGQAGDDVDEEARTIAGKRARSFESRQARLPPPRGHRKNVAPPVLGPISPGAPEALSADSPLVIASAAATPGHVDLTLPPQAQLIGLPGRGRASTFHMQSDRRLVIGLISASLVVVLMAIGVLLLRGDDDSEATHSASLTRERASLLKDPSSLGPARKAPVVTATLPLGTWGADESSMAAARGDDEASDARDRTPSRGADESEAKADAEHGAIAKDRTKEEGKAKAEAKEQPSETKQKTEQTRPKPAQTRPKPKQTKPPPRPAPLRAVAQHRLAQRRRTRVAAAAPPRGNNANLARKRAESAYRSRKFKVAASLLRNAAKSDAKEASKLRALAQDYEAVAANLSKAQSSEGASPSAAMAAYQRALRLDQRAGGAHSPYIRIKLGAVAPRAAASFMAQRRHVAAKQACDAAVNYGAGGHPMIRRVRATLERMAGQSYAQALKLRSSNRAAADKLLRTVLRMVPRDSAWYAKASRVLRQR